MCFRSTSSDRDEGWVHSFRRPPSSVYTSAFRFDWIRIVQEAVLTDHDPLNARLRDIEISLGHGHTAVPKLSGTGCEIAI